jgi:hypothetical protein
MIKGSKLTPEQRQRMVVAQAYRKGVPRSEEVKLKISLKHKGKILSVEHKKKLSEAKLKNPVRYWAGRKLHPNTVEARKNAHVPCPWKDKNRLKMTGENHWNWKGGISPENVRIRRSLEYIQWRRSVMQRDNFQCVIGGKAHGNKLQVDHIKPFAKYHDLRFETSNGRTLCVDCHKKTETYGSKKRVVSSYSL